MTCINDLTPTSTKLFGMLNWLRKRKGPIGRRLLGGFVSLWLVAAAAPCMAMTLHEQPPHRPCADAESVLDQGIACEHCEQATAPNCALPDSNAPVAATPNFSFTPVILTTVPAVSLTPAFFAPPLALQTASPPLYLTHLALLF